MTDKPIPLPDLQVGSADSAPAAAAATPPDRAAQEAAEWQRMVRIRGARHAGASARRSADERPR